MLVNPNDNKLKAAEEANVDIVSKEVVAVTGEDPYVMLKAGEEANVDIVSKEVVAVTGADPYLLMFFWFSRATISKTVEVPSSGKSTATTLTVFSFRRL